MRRNSKSLLTNIALKMLGKTKLEKGCLVWTASRLSSGYGQATRLDANARWANGLPVQEGAHRVSYKLFRGDIPDNLLVRHLCHNKLCIHPNHLAVGTQKDNMEDSNMSLKAKQRRRNSMGRFV